MSDGRSLTHESVFSDTNFPADAKYVLRTDVMYRRIAE